MVVIVFELISVEQLKAFYHNNTKFRFTITKARFGKY